MVKPVAPFDVNKNASRIGLGLNYTTTTIHPGNIPGIAKEMAAFGEEQDEEQPGGCYSAVNQCLQETSFSGFKYLVLRNSGIFQR